MKMNNKSIKVPFLKRPYIKNAADAFRKEFWNYSIPVDIEKIIEIRLKIDVIPVPNLQDLFGIDALITSNWQSIYIDLKRYFKDSYRGRLRFSLAHEMGHSILHKNIYNSFGIKTIGDFYKIFDLISQEQYGYLESQASKWASYLLIPREKLIIEKDKILEKLKAQNDSCDFEKLDPAQLNSYLAIEISNIFGVSQDAAEVALSDIDA